MEFGSKDFGLGTLKEIHSRTNECPFCRLVTKSLCDQPHEKGEEIPLTNQDVNGWPDEEAVYYEGWQVNGRILQHDQNGNTSVHNKRIESAGPWRYSKELVVLASCYP